MMIISRSGSRLIYQKITANLPLRLAITSSMNKNAQSPAMVDIMNCESNGMARCLMSEYNRRISIAIAGKINRRLKLFVICISSANGINPDAGKSISDCMKDFYLRESRKISVILRSRTSSLVCLVLLSSYLESQIIHANNKAS